MIYKRKYFMSLYITFLPDGHYAYPDMVISDKFSVPLNREEILNLYLQADCNSYAMGGEDPEDDGGAIFDEWGNYNVYGKVYFCWNIESDQIDDIWYLVSDRVHADQIPYQPGYYYEGTSMRYHELFVEGIREAGGDVLAIGENGDSITGVADSFTDDQLVEFYVATEGNMDGLAEEMVKRGMDLKALDAMVRIKKRMK